MDNELLQAISDMMDKKLEPINQRLDIIEYKEDRNSKKLDDLQLDMRLAERDIRKDIHTLRDEMDTVIELLKIHKMIQI